MRRHVYAGGPERAAHRRGDAAWIAERLSDPATRFVPVWRGRSLIVPGPPARAVLLGAEALEAAAAPDGPGPLFLGAAPGDAVRFALDLSALDEAAAHALAGAGEWAELRPLGALLEPGEAALLAYARGLVHWHRRHRFCGACGAPTRSGAAGHLRVCTGDACAAEHFPRTDPAVIVRVVCGERLLLGRSHGWAPGVYSTLAGFVEPGESLEEAVAREVLEEAGVAVRDVAYHSSQPWPFPASIMLGFTAAAEEETLRVDRTELEDARWWSRAEMREAMARGTLALPNPASIARRLIDEWLEAGADLP